MEDLILNALYQNPGIEPGQLLAILPYGCEADTLRVAAFNVFRRVARDEQEWLLRGMTLNELALRFDRLIGLALRRDGRGEAIQSGEGRYV
jgi:hypothetical protein